MKKVFYLFTLFLFVMALPASGKGAGLTEVRLKVPERYKTGVFSTEKRLMALPGLKVSVFAAGLEGPRHMAVGPDGTLYVSLPSEGTVVALPDRDRDGEADEAVVFASNLNRPHGLAIRGSELIVAEVDKVISLKDTNNDLKADSRETLTKDIPGSGGHWTKSLAVSPDKTVYISAGSSCNACVEDDKRRAAILKLSNKGVEVFARGLRNSVGIAFDPLTGGLWAADNGRDMLGDDIPPEELNRIVENGDYGWPYCYGDKIPDPDLGSRARCEGTIAPEVKMQAHSAPLGIAFGYGLKFPDEYRDVVYIAFHGSWNRSVPTGYKLIAVPFINGRPSGKPFDVVTGWLKDETAWGRPVEPVVGKDGALYLTDDRAGAIYRIAYE